MGSSSRKIRRGPLRSSSARADVQAERLATRMVECLQRWKQLPIGQRFEERCPFCRALVLVTNKAEDSDVSHALPACELWSVGLMALGAHSPRVERA